MQRPVLLAAVAACAAVVLYLRAGIQLAAWMDAGLVSW